MEDSSVLEFPAKFTAFLGAPELHLYTLKIATEITGSIASIHLFIVIVAPQGASDIAVGCAPECGQAVRECGQVRG